MQPIEIFCCQNEKCADHGVRGKGNLRFQGWSGQGKRIRMIVCSSCKTHFSERKGTVLEQSRLSKEKAISILDHIREGCGTRSASRLVKVDKNTVTRYIHLAGDHAVKMHDELVAVSPHTREVQFDEKWSFVGQKKEDENKQNASAEPCCGQNWDHTAIDAESRLLLSLVPGQRTAANCLKLIKDVKQRTGGHTNILLSSDEHAPYATAIEQVYAKKVPQPKRPGPGRPPKPKNVMPEDLCYGTVCKKREKGHVVEVVRTVVFGTVTLLMSLLALSTISNTINTSFVERNNGTDRGQNKRKARKTYAFSKDWELHNAASFFIGFSYNFCWAVRTLRRKEPATGKWQKRTPAMAAGLSDHIWSIEEWLCYPVISG